MESWTGTAVEHLYGGEQRFKAGFADRPVHVLADEFSWAESPFRCLHVCFLRRSSRQHPRDVARTTPLEYKGFGRVKRARKTLLRAIGRPHQSWWKLEKYRQGELAAIDDVAGFFPQRASTPST
jgi:hypothetical protein